MASHSFVDYVKIYLKSGHGGPGVVRWRREKYVNKGGPEGGDGGKGASIVLEGNQQMWTLLDLKYRKHIRAEDGKAGENSCRTGKSGKDIVLQVPLGTIIKDHETGKVLAEINEHKERKVLAPGGDGGLGNWHFKSPTRQTPEYAGPGHPGVEVTAIFELKILADVGLVGFPNAGKSTLLSVLSAAKPKIAAYPFTTIVPNLGIVSYKEDHSFVMADIPGIIKDAHKGKGLGAVFLRHIERNPVLLFLIPADAENIYEEYKVLLNELGQYKAELLDKKRIIGVSKADLINPEEPLDLEELKKEGEVVVFSSITRIGLDSLLDKLWVHLKDMDLKNE